MNSKVLMLEPYYAGSHQSFIEGLREESRHDIALLHLKPSNWRWLMRTAPTELAAKFDAVSEDYDVTVCSSYLDLASFRGMIAQPKRLGRTVCFFHENQISYPLPEDAPLDWGLAFINLTTYQAADEVWFNSLWHQNEFFRSAAKLVRMLPARSRASLRLDQSKSRVVHLGCDIPPKAETPVADAKVPRILWNHRWEHDKRPELFVAGLRHLKERGLAFELVVLGSWLGDEPALLAELKREFQEELEHCGYLESRSAYFTLLQSCDIVVSMALHDNFGLAMLEGIGSGCMPLMPKSLSYLELYERFFDPRSFFTYESEFVTRLSELVETRPRVDLRTVEQIRQHFAWTRQAAEIDQHLDQLSCRRGPSANSSCHCLKGFSSTKMRGSTADCSDCST